MTELTDAQCNHLIDRYVAMGGIPSLASSRMRLCIVDDLGGWVPVKRTQPAVVEPDAFFAKWDKQPDIWDTGHDTHVLLYPD